MRFQKPYMPVRNRSGPTSGRRASSRKLESVTLALSVASRHIFDSLMPRRIAHSASASTNRCPNTMRMPSSPSPDSANAISSTTTGPSIHSTWATPASLPRALAGAVSAISVQLAGTSAPTARPART
jgi:hypothetical protein